LNRSYMFRPKTILCQPHSEIHTPVCCVCIDSPVTVCDDAESRSHDSSLYRQTCVTLMVVDIWLARSSCASHRRFAGEVPARILVKPKITWIKLRGITQRPKHQDRFPKFIHRNSFQNT
jgi:hypothetical protein